MPVDDAALDALADRDVVGTDAFTVAEEHTTTVFGEQTNPPGPPAAVDADPTEAASVLGTPHLLARFEFASRAALRGHLPDGTGVVGEAAAVTHRRPVSVGETVAVTTRLEAVAPPSLTFDCRAEDEAGRTVGTGDVTLRVVDRDRFRDAL
ncbi:thioesterase family protein [Halobacteriaceae archaeon GCM10025711]